MTETRKVIRIGAAANPTRLVAELAAVEGLALRTNGVVSVWPFAITSDDKGYAVEVPGDVDDAAVLSVIAQHDATPPPAPTKADFGSDIPSDQDEKLADAVAALRAYIGAASPSGAQTVAALKLVARLILWMLKRQGA